MGKLSFATALVLCCTSSTWSSANEDIYISYGADGTPIFSAQPHDGSYSLYLQGNAAQGNQRQNSRPVQGSASLPRMWPLIRQIAEEQGVAPSLIGAIIEVESGFNFNVVSVKGAIGAMQLLPETAARYGVTNLQDPRQNLTAGVRYLKDLLTAYQGNLPLALAAYNAGQRNVRRHNQRIPPFNETMLYVPKVLAKKEAYEQADSALAP